MRRFFFLCLLVSHLASAQTSPVAQGVVHEHDVDLSYWVYGAASQSTPAIVVNGGPGFAHTYLLLNDVWSKLSQTRQIAFYDQRGDGESKLLNANAPQGMAAQVADLEALRVKLGYQKFDLIGYSWGGLLAMGYAAAHPEHVKSLILLDSAAPSLKDTQALFDKVYPDVAAKDAEIDKKLGNTPQASQEELSDYLGMLFYSQAHHDAFIAKLDPNVYNPAVGDAVTKAVGKLNLASALPKFSFPTLVITGRFDLNVPPQTAWKMYKAIPHATFVVFSESGHAPFFEEPEKFEQVVGSFLAMH